MNTTLPRRILGLEDLGIDILLLVADEVCRAFVQRRWLGSRLESVITDVWQPKINNMVREQIPNFRLVSRQCDLVARRILFRSITFDEKRLEGAVADEHLIGSLRVHLRHVVLRTWMDWEGLIELLSGCVRFEGLT